MAPLSKWSTACGAARAWRRRFAHSLRGLWRGAGTSGDLRRGVPECMQPRMTARPLAMRSSWFLASCCSGPYDCLNVLIRFDCTCTRLRHRRAGPCPTWSSGTFAGWPAKRSVRRKCKRARKCMSMRPNLAARVHRPPAQFQFILRSAAYVCGAALR